jgi:hypothetical protein
MSYIKPNLVSAPSERWNLIKVVIDNGAGSAAWAIGLWDGVPRIAMRWNGSRSRPLGNPTSRGKPTWFMIDEDAHAPMIEHMAARNPALAAFVREFFAGRAVA